jgi:RNA polymerase sigma-70 factor, ECF subfamily
MATDNELIGCVQAGDQQAWDELYRRYLPTLWRFAIAQMRPDEAAASDAVSETFLVAVQRVGSFDGTRGSVGAWLTGIARHKIADIRRGKSAVPLVVAQPEAASGDSAGRLVREETRAAVARVVLALDDDQRLALEWKYLDGISVREIAHRLDRTEKAAEALLYRAREEFRRRARPLLDHNET